LRDIIFYESPPKIKKIMRHEKRECKMQVRERERLPECRGAENAKCSVKEGVVLGEVL